MQFGGGSAPRPGATTSGRLAKTAMTKVEMMVMAAVAVIMLVFMSARHLLYPYSSRWCRHVERSVL